MANNINSKWVQNMKHPLLVPFLVSVLGAIKYPPQINREDIGSVDRDSCHLKKGSTPTSAGWPLDLIASLSVDFLCRSLVEKS